jgi:hypothetical protein
MENTKEKINYFIHDRAYVATENIGFGIQLLLSR